MKVKNVRNTDVVVGGWVGGDGGRLGKIGALVIGFTTEDGELRYAGKVGTGFNEAELKRLQGMLDPLARDDTPVHRHPAARRRTHFIEPTLVASVDYGDDHRRRHAAPPGLQGPARRPRPGRGRSRPRE